MAQLKLKILLLTTGVAIGGFAQEAVPATGGEAVGAGGSTTYSVGQVVYTMNTGTNGTVLQGVQQPYEIFTTSGADIKDIKLELTIYPNPTTDIFYLKVENIDFSTLSYRLTDSQGKLVDDKKLTGTVNLINMEEQAIAIYFLKILKDGVQIKSFKIVKN